MRWGQEPWETLGRGGSVRKGRDGADRVFAYGCDNAARQQVRPCRSPSEFDHGSLTGMNSVPCGRPAWGAAFFSRGVVGGLVFRSGLF